MAANKCERVAVPLEVSVWVANIAFALSRRYDEIVADIVRLIETGWTPEQIYEHVLANGSLPDTKTEG